jgi:NitT/TauT family transport system substrate-binding protein
MPIKLCETFRALFYTPFYLPFALGSYEAEGLEVELATSPAYDKLAEQLRDGMADVYWGGPMRILRMRDRKEKPELWGFCEAITRDPFFILGPEPRPDFKVEDLASMTLNTVSEVPTPWLCLQEDLRQAGLDPNSLNRITDKTMAENTASLRAGEAEAVQLFQPFVEELVASGAGHIWYAQASRGPCSYTTFYATAEMMAAQPDDLLRMTRAMYRAQQWLHANSPEEIATAVGDFLPDVDHGILAAAAKRYIDLGVWGKDPILPRDGFEKLRDGLLSDGFINSEPAFEDCIDNRFAEAVIAE